MPLPAGVDPRPYQKQEFQELREVLRTNRAACLEAPTGSGKSVLAAMVVDAFEDMNRLWKLERHIYFLVNEIFLLFQFSDHLEKWGVRHDVIGDGKYEGRPVFVHVATVQTLRKHPPKNTPALFIVDEAQYSTAPQYMDLFADYPDAKIIGITATPEGPSGKGLSLNSKCGIFNVLIKSPVTALELTEMGYLCPVKYYAPPCSLYENVAVSQGDFNTSEVDKLIAENGVFGDTIKQIQRFPVDSHILVFCKSVKACYDLQIVFTASGYSAEVIEGNLLRKDRKRVMGNFVSGRTQVLINCKMVTKGVDIPQIKMTVDIQPGLSRGMWKQKVGRVMRIFEGKEFGYHLDMVGNITRATKTGWVYEDIDWRFDSEAYNKKSVSLEAADMYCPLCFAHIPPPGNVCPECGAAKSENAKRKKEEEEKRLEGDLVEAKPIPIRERPPEERREFIEAVAAAVKDQDIEKLKEIGACIIENKKNIPFWIYRTMNQKEKILDIPLLYRIQRSFGYASGWVWFAKKELSKRGFSKQANELEFN